MDMSVYAASAPVARIVRAEGANGAVSVKYRGTDSFISVWRHEKIGAGDTIATGSDGGAELAFPGGTILVLGPSAEIEITDIAPRYAGDDGSDRVVYDVSVRLGPGRVRAAAPPGPRVLITAGWASVLSNPVTGADLMLAADVFAAGYYLRVSRGCAFALLRSGTPAPICGDGRVKIEMFADRLTRLPGSDPYAEFITLPVTAEPPLSAPVEEILTRITINGKRSESPDGTFRIVPGPAGAEKPADLAGTVAGGWAALISVDGGSNWITVAPDENGAWRYRMDLVPADGYDLLAKTVYIGAPPPDITASAETQTTPPGEETAAPGGEEADPDAVASRFVRAFTAALTRGDTGALSALVSPDYSGSAGGAGRSAMLRGVSDFFRAGGTLSVSAYVTGASTADGTVIATMSFSSRVNGAPRSGNLRLWLTPDGTLTHAEGQWVL
jgi:hypothetical protein